MSLLFLPRSGFVQQGGSSGSAYCGICLRVVGNGRLSYLESSVLAVRLPATLCARGMSYVQVIKANPSHAERACQLVIHSIREACKKDHRDDDKTISEWISNKTIDNFHQWIKSENSYSYVAINSKNEVIGFSLMSKTGKILLNYINPEYLYKGVGKALLLKMEEDAKRRDISVLSTDSTLTALSFYERNGFLITDVQKCNKLQCVPLTKYIST